jgi:hypothetical protein
MKSWEAAYKETLILHLKYTREAGYKIGVRECQLLAHDASKWSELEFPAYAAWFKGTKGNPDAFARAWLHHIHNNPHHWQYWIFSDGYTLERSKVENGVVEMPARFALEMVADWMGASMAYTGDWDIADWLENNMAKIRIHSQTAQYLREVLDHLGYADIVYTYQFSQEIT